MTQAEMYFKILIQIPEEDFIIGKFTDGSKCCAIGHLLRIFSPNSKDYSYKNILWSPNQKVDKFVYQDVKKILGHSLAAINNGDSSIGKPFISLDSPKKRVIKALEMIIEKENVLL